MAMLFSAVITVEKPPDETRAAHPLLQAFHAYLHPCVIPLPYKAATPHPCLTFPGRKLSTALITALVIAFGIHCVVFGLQPIGGHLLIRRKTMMTLLKRCSPIRSWCQLATALTIIALLSVSQVALAQGVDTKVYPGASCQPTRFAFTDPVRPFLYDELGRIVNLASGISDPLAVICPVVRDQTSGTAGIRAAFVRFRKATPAAGVREGADDDISCTLFSRTHLGGRGNIDPVDMGTAVYAGPPRYGILTIRPTPITSSDQRFPGYYYLMCLIPPALQDEEVEPSDENNSSIISYRVDEIRSSLAEGQEADEDEM
jgi:hypothetical protein